MVSSLLPAMPALSLSLSLSLSSWKIETKKKGGELVQHQVGFLLECGWRKNVDGKGIIPQTKQPINLHRPKKKAYSPNGILHKNYTKSLFCSFWVELIKYFENNNFI